MVMSTKTKKKKPRRYWHSRKGRTRRCARRGEKARARGTTDSMAPSGAASRSSPRKKKQKDDEGAETKTAPAHPNILAFLSKATTTGIAGSAVSKASARGHEHLAAVDKTVEDTQLWATKHQPKCVSSPVNTGARRTRPSAPIKHFYLFLFILCKKKPRAGSAQPSHPGPTFFSVRDKIPPARPLPPD